MHSWSYSVLWLSCDFVPKSHHAPEERKCGVRDTRREIMNWWINKQRRGRQALCEQELERHRGTLDISIRHPCLLFIAGLSSSQRFLGEEWEVERVRTVTSAGCSEMKELKGSTFNRVCGPWDLARVKIGGFRRTVHTSVFIADSIGTLMGRFVKTGGTVKWHWWRHTDKAFVFFLFFCDVFNILLSADLLWYFRNLVTAPNVFDRVQWFTSDWYCEVKINLLN